MNGRAMSLPVMAPDQGRLIAIDAIDGAGKNTALNAISKWLREQGKRIFDGDAWQMSHGLLPRGDDESLATSDTLIVSQPTHAGIGLAIREEIMQNPAYNAWSTAQAFALDRQMLYVRTVLPFLRAKPGRIVIQVRGLMSSLTYQTVQAADEGTVLTIKELLTLPGNALELSRPPNLSLVLTVTPETAAKRLANRTEKIDGDKFADPRFQARVSLRYRAKDVLEPFQRLGSNIVFLDAEKSKEDVAAECVAHLRSLIET